MKKILIYISLFVFAIGGCKKVDLDEVPSGDPVFMVNAELDGVQLNLVAGDDDVYMFSEFSKDNFGVYTMTGRFAKDTNCQTNCEESLSFSIRSSSVDSIPNLPFDINSAIVVGSDSKYFTDNVISIQNGFRYDFNGELIDSFFNSTADSFHWTINNIPYFDDSISFNYFDSSDLNVRLEVLTNDGCISYFEKIIPVGMDDNCELNIEVIPNNSFDVFELLPSFNSQNGGNADFIWTPQSNLGDTFLIDSNFQIPPNNIISLSAMNDSCYIDLGVCLGGNMGGGIPSSIAFSRFDFLVDPVTIVTTNPDKQLSAITIEYQDATGIYSSKFADNSSPNSNSTFTIIKIEDYEDNENGEKTKKLTIAYDCILGKEGSVETKNITGSAEIAVAYPD